MARALLALIVVLSIAGCWGGGGPGAAYYADLLASLEVPAGWELAHTRAREPLGTNPCGPGDIACPAGHRYYYVRGEPAEVYPVARNVMLDAGFEVARENPDACEPEGNALGDCWMESTRDSDVVDVFVYEPGRDPSELGIARDGFSVVELRGFHNPRADGD